MNCRNAEKLLSEYIDNSLSARETWGLDKHLAECNLCTRQVNELRRTVALLADAPSFSVSDDFAANLQARIARVKPEPARNAWLQQFRDVFRPRTRPLWLAGTATCALAIIVAVRLIPEVPKEIPRGVAAGVGNETRFVQSARTHSIALAASDPFGDTAAANVAASVESLAPAENPDPQGGQVY